MGLLPNSPSSTSSPDKAHVRDADFAHVDCFWIAEDSQVTCRFWVVSDMAILRKQSAKVASLTAKRGLGFGETSHGAHMRLNWKRASWGALIGVVLATFLAEHRVRQVAAEQGQVAPTGLNPVPYMYSYHFWFFLLVFTIFLLLCAWIHRAPSQRF